MAPVGLTTRTRHARRALPGLRGPFCPRLASAFNHRPAYDRCYYIVITQGTQAFFHTFGNFCKPIPSRSVYTHFTNSLQAMPTMIRYIRSHRKEGEAGDGSRFPHMTQGDLRMQVWTSLRLWPASACSCTVSRKWARGWRRPPATKCSTFGGAYTQQGDRRTGRQRWSPALFKVPAPPRSWWSVS